MSFFAFQPRSSLLCVSSPSMACTLLPPWSRSFRRPISSFLLTIASTQSRMRGLSSGPPFLACPAVILASCWSARVQPSLLRWVGWALHALLFVHVDKHYHRLKRLATEGVCVQHVCPRQGSHVLNVLFIIVPTG